MVLASGADGLDDINSRLTGRCFWQAARLRQRRVFSQLALKGD